MLVKAITAFTVAHSISLALATLGVVNIPSKPTEAVIALSIVFLALEVLRRNAGNIAVRAPWIVVFGFGLVHGLGFAGALSTVGLPQHAIPLALFTFNVGVEVGQLMFVAVVLVIIATIHRFHLTRGLFNPRLVPYIIGAVAAYWVIDRTVSFLQVS